MRECERLDFWKSKGATDEEAFKIAALFYARGLLDEEYFKIKAEFDKRPEYRSAIKAHVETSKKEIAEGKLSEP